MENSRRGGEYSQTRVDAATLNASSFVGVDNLVADKDGRVDATYMPNTERLTAYEEGDILLGNIRPYLKKVWKATTLVAVAVMCLQYAYRKASKK